MPLRGFHQSCRLLRLCRPLRDFVSCLPYPPFPCRAFLYRRFAAITSSESRRQPSWSEFQLRRFMVLYFHSPREGDGRRYVTAFADRNVRATRANATREFCGLLHPALKNSVSVGPLRCVFDHRVTGEAASRRKPLAERVSGEKQATERHAEVVCLADLE